jgi:predicted NBD/HSP70 family sugar kinase
LAYAAEPVGRVVAMLVNAYNPTLLLVGGEVAADGDLLS